jgi:hypothetical protein
MTEFRGLVEADALVVDTPLLGEAQARSRVLGSWLPGSRALALPDGRWLLVLPHAVPVRADRAPGLPVRTGGAGEVRLTWHGVTTVHRLAALPVLPVPAWVDLGGVPVEVLSPVQVAAPVAVAAPALDRPAPVDLRRAANVGQDRTAERIARELATPSPRRGLLERLADDLLGRVPATAMTRRHRRYVRELAETFERRDWDAALRRAIALGGAGGRRSLRLPRPRTGALRPTAVQRGRGVGVPVGTLDQYLRTLYTRAAEELERLGRIEEAAFVHADLLHAPWDTVRLLERHGRFRLAAELAEGRRMEPETTVRLWWRAGLRRRAVALAVRRGAFAGAIDRLAGVDPAGAVELRRLWVDRLRSTGDLLGAVRAAWPVAELREGVVPDLEAAMAAGGPAGGELLARMVTHRPTPAGLDLADGLLAGGDPALAVAAGRFVATLGELTAGDPAADRRLATAALRSAVRDGALDDLDPHSAGRAERALRARADRLAAADLPRPAARRRGAEGADVLAGEAGAVVVRDAVALAGGVLVALGDLGVRLLTPDGRVRARWDVPTDVFSVADHGGTVLFVSRGEQFVDLHRLDVARRRVEHWTALRARQVLPSHDGLLAVLDDQGMAFLDVAAPGVRVAWRELSAGVAVLDVARSPGNLAAVVHDRRRGGTGVPEVWHWTLPDLTLRGRPPLQPDLRTTIGGSLAATGDLLALQDDGSSATPRLWYVTPHGRPREIATGADGLVVRVLAAGHLLFRLLSTPSGESAVDLFRPTPGSSPPVRVRFPGVPAGADPPLVGARLHGDVLVVHDTAGRVAAVDVRRGTTLANLVVAP